MLTEALVPMVKVTSPSDRTARSRVCRAVADGARRHAHVTCCQASISRGRGELGHHRHDVMGTQGAGLTCANLGLKDCLPPALLLCNGKTTGPSQMKTVLVDRHIHDKLDQARSLHARNTIPHVTILQLLQELLLVRRQRLGRGERDQRQESEGRT